MKKAGVLVLLALLSIMILPLAAQRATSHDAGKPAVGAHGNNQHESGNADDNETQEQNHHVQSHENDTGSHEEVKAHENETDSHEEIQTHENDTSTVHEDDGHPGENETGEVHQEPNQIRFSTEVRLTGAQQSPSVSTEAFGEAQVRLVDNGTALRFRVEVCNIENVTGAHIHVNTTMANGPIVLFLYRAHTPLLSVEGCAMLSSGVLTGANLTAQASVGVSTWSDFVNALLAGRAYINVHTTQNPGGEIRGQLRPETDEGGFEGECGPPLMKVDFLGMGIALARVCPVALDSSDV